jgi:hypothetical protein
MAPQATEQGKDCVMCKVFELGWCKTEFEVMDCSRAAAPLSQP